MSYTTHTRHGLRRDTPVKALLTAFALILFTAACDGPVGPQGERGPQGAQGEQGPQGPAGQDGQDGTANATLYVFPGWDFAADAVYRRTDDFYVTVDDANAAASKSTWLYYLRKGPWRIDVPGWGYQHASEYYAGHVPYANNTRVGFYIQRISGPGEAYDNVHIIRIQANDTINCTNGCLRAASESLIPEDLDVSDYDAVVDYFGIAEDDIVRM